MRSLDRKLLRDLRLMWSQALTIALVVASGIGGFITSLSAVDSLSLARDRFYTQGRFADVFASVKRAPAALAETLREVPGVADVQTTLEQIVRVEIAGQTDPVIGQLIGLKVGDAARMNRVSVSRGRMPERNESGSASGGIEVLVSEGFAQARGLVPGSRLDAQINGRRRVLVVVGTALSPEFIFAGLWGMPDTRGFGVFWLDHDVLAAAYDMHGAFNRVAIKLAPGASEQRVVDALSRLLSPYGGREANGRDRQTSHAMLDNEIKEQRVLGTVLPAIFLAVAAFLLNVVVSRLVSTQREQIAALKALGYPNRSIGLHYLKLVLLVVLLGLVLGVLLGDRLGTMFTGLYAEFFHFPSFEHRIAPWLLVVSFGVAVATAVAGTFNAILATVRLAPAEAMRPPAPGSYRPTLLERIGVHRMAPALRMIVRNVERRPLRSALSVGGVAAAVAIVVMGNFFRDAIEVIVDTQFTLSLRGDITVWTPEAVDDAVRLEIARLPGVKAVETSRFVPVSIVSGHREERSLIRGYAARPELYRLIDVAGKELALDGRGLVLTDRLADKLGVRVGDPVRVKILEGRERTLELVVGATVRDMMGLNAYMDRTALNRALGEGDLSTGFVLALERGTEPQALEASKALPRIAGAWSKTTMLRNMQEISARNVRIMSTILTAFASVIAVGVVYNNARIALAERAWELASLRVLGFTRGEVSGLLLGELALVIALALPLGMLLGWGLTHTVTELLKSDQFLFPVVIRARTYAWAALCVVAAGVASALVVRRRIDRLDMVSALKTRD
ncbi:FtsX-like permease family protein [Piscinibacter sp. HJYY11]|uniref:ABC transporter permease n=1 Tax=Piscinibacter sp. HJYY11 TaxID=2801333 RepID=UPI00191E3D64|nr:FtsX-like permease family protein [Piscinibacter sp. HJYY11]MBL0726579.1 ABC transporter permease [Piscinibacter sp. HJYY11]